MAFQCVLVTPEQQLIDEPVSHAVIPASDGLLGILTDRSPLLAKLAIGPLRLDLASGQKRSFLVDGGIAQMKGNKLTILTPSAMAAEEIDAGKAAAEYTAAVERTTHDRAEAEKRAGDIQRGRVKMGLAKK
jgi:F-type H+-transporting ATPase subunit epsilon